MMTSNHGAANRRTTLSNHPVYDSAVGSIKLARIVISNNIQPTQDGTGEAYVIPVEGNEHIIVQDSHPLFARIHDIQMERKHYIASHCVRVETVTPPRISLWSQFIGLFNKPLIA
jgi:hypothetical protein